MKVCTQGHSPICHTEQYCPVCRYMVLYRRAVETVSRTYEETAAMMQGLREAIEKTVREQEAE